MDEIMKQILDIEYTIYVSELLKKGLTRKEAELEAREEVEAEYYNFLHKSRQAKMVEYRKRLQLIKNKIKEDNLINRLSNIKL